SYGPRSMCADLSRTVMQSSNHTVYTAQPIETSEEVLVGLLFLQKGRWNDEKNCYSSFGSVSSDVPCGLCHDAGKRGGRGSQNSGYGPAGNRRSRRRERRGKYRYSLYGGHTDLRGDQRSGFR